MGMVLLKTVSAFGKTVLSRMTAGFTAYGSKYDLVAKCPKFDHTTVEETQPSKLQLRFWILFSKSVINRGLFADIIWSLIILQPNYFEKCLFPSWVYNSNIAFRVLWDVVYGWTESSRFHFCQLYPELVSSDICVLGGTLEVTATI